MISPSVTPSTHLTAHNYLKKAFLQGNLNQKELASAVGLQPNVISMILAGKCKLPPERGMALVTALGGDEMLMAKLLCRDYLPTIYPFIIEWSDSWRLSTSEQKLVLALREATSTSCKV